MQDFSANPTISHSLSSSSFGYSNKGGITKNGSAENKNNNGDKANPLPEGQNKSLISPEKNTVHDEGGGGGAEDEIQSVARKYNKLIENIKKSGRKCLDLENEQLRNDFQVNEKKSIIQR